MIANELKSHLEAPVIVMSAADATGAPLKTDGEDVKPAEEAASGDATLADATSELTSAVDEMLKQLGEKFGRVSEEMITRSELLLSSLSIARVPRLVCHRGQS